MYNLFNTLATLFFHLDADQNTSSTLNLTGLLALRQLLRDTECGLKEKKAGESIFTLRKRGVQKVQLFNSVDKLRSSFCFSHRKNNLKKEKRCCVPDDDSRQVDHIQVQAVVQKY